jgi:predicted O-methyltransferase YrrM
MSDDLRQLNLKRRGQLDDAIESVLVEYEKRGAAEFALQADIGEEQWHERRDEFLIAVGRETGTLLNILAKAIKAQVIVELGTSYGYSTVWLAEAARKTGGKVISLDLSAEKQDYASQVLRRAGLATHVEFLPGDARETLASLPGPFDFVLVDLWKDLYISCFDLFYPKLNPGAFIAADNMLRPESYRPHAIAYRRHARSKPKIDSVLLPVGSGVELSRYGDSLSA